MKTIRIVLWAAVVVMAGILGWLTYEMTQSKQQAATGPFGVPFTLTAQDGKEITEKAFTGKPTALFFGFTHCPEVCPTTLFELTTLLGKLGAEADKLNVLFVSVDPERDTPAQLSLYLQSFDPRIVGLSGTQAEVDAALKAYKAYARRIPTPDGYTMDHTASVYLMDAEGRFRSLIDYHEEQDSALAKVRLLLKR